MGSCLCKKCPDYIDNCPINQIGQISVCYGYKKEALIREGEDDYIKCLDSHKEGETKCDAVMACSILWKNPLFIDYRKKYGYITIQGTGVCINLFDDSTWNWEDTSGG